VEFPVYLRVGSLSLHPHWVFEVLAYFIGTRLYFALKARWGDPIADDARWTVVAAAVVGCALGSKLLYWLSDPPVMWEHRFDPVFLLGGKSIVGGLIGGLIAVEWVKRRIGVTRSTGDLFGIPLAVGIAVGRIGCFLTGLDDHTYGLPTTLPWGVDFGDGVARHPTQLYEIAFLLLILTPLLVWLHRRRHREGDLFKAFMVGYLGFRLALEAIKPGVFFGPLNAIQWACLGTLLYYGWHYYREYRARERAACDDEGGAPAAFHSRPGRSRPGHSKPARARQVTGG
jgi:phosphatidylglycerol---prolipoprotein diacylglyceryl transferase